MRTAILALTLSLLPFATLAGEVDYRWVRDGKAEVIDGETIRFDGKPMRLWGVSAPALDQTCTKPDGTVWPCGEWARDQLAILIGREPLKCFGRGPGPDYDGIELVQCWNARHNLNYSMIEFGAALAYRPHTSDFQGSERFASRRGLGLWSGSFEPPWQHRARKASGT